MQRRLILGASVSAPMAAALGTAAAASLLAANSKPAAAQTSNRASLDDLLRPYLAQYGLPALAAAVVQRGTIVAAGAVGTRRAGTQIPITVDDRFHIGSDTKAMTSLLAATFVEQGKLRWDSTVAEVFPDLVAGMNPDLGKVTLLQLLSHTSGLPSDNDTFGDLLTKSFALDSMNLDELRLWLVREWRGQKMAAPPGTKWAYSNLGYTMAGAMLERVSGRTWEELIVERIYTPFGLKSAGFGPQSSMGRVDAPLGHVIEKNGTLKPILAGPDADNPLIIGPAGTAHLSVLDFATWAGWHAAGGKRAPHVVKPETVTKLHTKVADLPPRPDAAPGTPGTGAYALGWGIYQPTWAKEKLLTHNGSNMMNLASVWVLPSHDFAMVMMTNVSGTKADDALKALAQALYGKYGPA
ncbi:MAG: serine hydrolase domain-containing protein [Acetobacteraceae bacterium]